MRIAISTENDRVSAHFGRCPVFTIIDLKDGEIISRKTINNPGHAPGVIPNFLKEQKANVIICGGMGAKASSMFKSFGINTIVGIDDSIDNTIKKIQSNTLVSGASMCSQGAGKGHGIEKTVCDHK